MQKEGIDRQKGSIHISPFLDSDFKLRGTWYTEQEFGKNLTVRGPSTLYLGDVLAVDLIEPTPARLMPDETVPRRLVFFGGDSYTVPTW